MKQLVLLFHTRISVCVPWPATRAVVVSGLLLVCSFSVSACSRAEDAAPAPDSRSAATPAVSASGLTLVAGKAPYGTIVSLEPTIERDFPLPAGPAVMDQYGKQFVPGFLLVRVGQPVEFRNSEDTTHNVHVARRPTGTTILSVSTDSYQKHVHTFEQAGYYDVSCDIHPGMLATVAATSTPYNAIADDRGNFTIYDVEPGSYRLVAAGATRSERMVEISGARTDVRVGGS